MNHSRLAKAEDSSRLERRPHLAWEVDDLVELPLLLTGHQAAVLEAAANQRGLTPAQLVRRFIRTLEYPLPSLGSD